MTADWMRRVHVAQGFPKPNTDAAPDAVFLALFLFAALTNVFIFLRNQRRGHKFLFNGLLTGFCMARVVTTSLRLAWMYNIEDRGLAVAATIFVAAGVLILFIVNLLFAQRILRGLHPHLGWHKALSTTFRLLYLLILLMLAMVVTATVQVFFTTDRNIAKMDLDMQRAAGTYFMVFSFLPVPIVIFALAYPKENQPDHFGRGLFWHKAVVVLAAAVLLCLGAAFRTGTSFITYKADHWFNAKWAFYFFNFTLELTVVVMCVVLRIDLLFHVPDGSKGPYSYSRGKSGVAEDVEIRGLQQRSSDSIARPSESAQLPGRGQAEEKTEV